MSEKTPTAESLLNKMRDYLSKDKKQYKVNAELALYKTEQEKLIYLLQMVGEYCDPLFIFDNIESFQNLETGEWKAEHYDILEALAFISQNTRSPIIITGRYPILELPEIEVLNLNAVAYGDFLKKCWQLPLSQLAQKLVHNRLGAHKRPESDAQIPLTFDLLVQRLHRAFGGNYRALEFFDELRTEKGDEAVLGTLDKLEDVEKSLHNAAAEVRQKVSTNLVFNELLVLLSPIEKEVVQLLAYFRIPVLPMALGMQRENADFSDALVRLLNITLIECSETDRHNWYYVTPLVKDLLSDAHLKDVPFSDNSAADYHVYVDKEINDKNYNDLSEAFEFYCAAKNTEGVNTTGTTLSGFYYDIQQFQKALYYSLQAYEVCVDDTDSFILNLLGLIYDTFGEYDNALIFYEKSLSIQQSIGDRKGEGGTLNNLATTAHAKGEYDKALEYLEKSLSIQQSIGDRNGEGTTLNNISQIYDAKGEYDKALEYLEKSLSIRQSIGDRKGEGGTLNNLATTAHAKGEYDKALEYLEKSLSIQQSIGDRNGEGTTLNNISQIYDAKGEYDKALEYLEKSLSIQQSIGDRSGMCPTLHNIASIYLNQKEDIEKWLEYESTAFKIALEIGNTEGVYRIGQVFGYILCQNGAVEQGLPILKMAVEAGMKAGFSDVQKVINVYQHFSKNQ